MTSPLIINDLLKILRHLYKSETDPLVKDFYIDVGTAVNRLIERDELTYFDDWNIKETQNVIYQEMHWRTGGIKNDK